MGVNEKLTNETSALLLRVRAEMGPIAKRAGASVTTTSLFGGHIGVDVRRAVTMDGPTTLWRVRASTEVTRGEAERLVCRIYGVEIPGTGV